MFRFSASYMDGQSSAAETLEVSVDDSGKLHIKDKTYDLDKATISARLGNTTRKISFSDQSSLETADNDAIDQLLDRFKISKSQHLSHRLESNLKLAAAAAVIMLALAALFYRYGLPATSNLVTTLIPTSVDDQLGEQVLPQLDDFLFKETNIKQEQQDEIQNSFRQLLTIEPLTPRDYKLNFRDAPALGANALALPDASIVVTDDIVELLNKDELASVLLHEIGHIQHRHSMRMLVRQTLISSIILLATGDPGFANSLVIFLPQVLLETQHSRELETEADSFALEYMQTLNIPPKAFATAMQKIAGLDANEHDPSTEVKQDKGGDHSHRNRDAHDEEDSLMDYLSTHPAPQDRIDRFLEAQKVFESSR